jgi:hypothetical protein
MSYTTNVKISSSAHPICFIATEHSQILSRGVISVVKYVWRGEYGRINGGWRVLVADNREAAPWKGVRCLSNNMSTSSRPKEGSTTQVARSVATGGASWSGKSCTGGFGASVRAPRPVGSSNGDLAQPCCCQIGTRVQVRKMPGK